MLKYNPINRLSTNSKILKMEMPKRNPKDPPKSAMKRSVAVRTRRQAASAAALCPMRSANVGQGSYQSRSPRVSPPLVSVSAAAAARVEEERASAAAADAEVTVAEGGARGHKLCAARGGLNSLAK